MSSQPSPILHEWQRYWHVRGKPPVLDSNALLPNPEGEYTSYLNRDLFKLQDILPKTGPLLLCGDPGMGKSTELERLRSQLSRESSFVHWILFRDITDFSEILDLFQSDLWQRWQESKETLTLVIDGVDEGLLRIPRFLEKFTRSMRQEASIGRLRLIFACRGREWPDGPGEALFSLWNTDGKDRCYELCPLRQVDAELAAGSHGQAFWTAIQEHKVTTFAAKPVTLRFLLKEFTEHGILPRSHRELYSRGIDRLLNEPNKDVWRQLELDGKEFLPADLRAAAERLAVLMLVTGSAGILDTAKSGESANREDLSLDQAEDAADKSGRRVTHHSLRAVLRTALFQGQGSDRFNFAHQTFAECLASRSLISLDLVQIRNLLCRQEGGGHYVVPQLASLAAWVAGEHDGFRDFLLEHEPQTLLRGDVSVLDDASKASLVEAMLNLAKNDAGFERHRLKSYFSGLAYDGLAQQLKPIFESLDISDRCHLAISLAGECKQHELIPEITAVIYQPEAPQRLREWAAINLANLVPEDQLHLLEPLARGEDISDPRFTIQGAALLRLIPMHWPVREAIGHLPVKISTSYLGNYELLLGTVMPEKMEDEDVSEVLKFAASRADLFTRNHQGAKLIKNALERGFRLLERQGMTELLVSFEIQHFSEYHYPLSYRNEIWPSAIQVSHEARRKLLKTWLGAIEPDFEHLSILPRLNLWEDLTWLWQVLPTVPENRHRLWGRLIAYYLAVPENSDEWDVFMSGISRFPLAKEALTWRFDPIEIRSDLARDLRRMHRLDQKNLPEEVARRAAEKAARKRKKLEARLQVETEDASDAWLQLWLEMATSEHGHLRTSAISTKVYDCWETLEEDEKEICLLKAYRCLNAGPEQGLTPSMYGASASIAAFNLLMENLRLGDLDRETVVAWAPVLTPLCFEWNDQEDRRPIFEYLHGFTPEACETLLVVNIVREQNGHPDFCNLGVARDVWSPSLREKLLNSFDQIETDAGRFACLRSMREIDPEAASFRMSQFLQELTPADSAEKVRLTLVNGLWICPEIAFPIVAGMTEGSEEVAKAVWRGVCDDHPGKKERWYDGLNEAALSQLYEILVSLNFPPEAQETADEDLKRWQTVPFFRDLIPSLLAQRATASACQELTRLLARYPSAAELIKWNLNRALEAHRGASWQRPSLDEARKMLSSSLSRYITGPQDLLEVLIESLERLQKHLLHGKPPAFDDLWTWSGGGHQRSDFKYKDEEFISDYIARWLHLDLNRRAGLFINREVQPRRGNKHDIHVQAIHRDGQEFAEPITVVIEVKGCWNKEVKTGLKKQLVGTYLQPENLACGIYLVPWFLCDRWNDPSKVKMKAKDLATAEAEVKSYAANYAPGKGSIRVESFLLDCTPP